LVLSGQITVILGLGDFTPDAITALPDPCPLPMKERTHRRFLNEKDKIMYAPFSGVGGIVYDQDAVYIDLGGSHSHQAVRDTSENTQEDNEKRAFVSELRELKSTLDEKMDSAGLKLFSTSEPITGADAVRNELPTADSDEEEMQDEEDYSEAMSKNFTSVVADDGRVRRRVIFDDEDNEASEKTGKGLLDQSLDSDIEEDEIDDESEVSGSEEIEDDEDQEDEETKQKPGVHSGLSKDLQEAKDKMFSFAEEAFYSRFRNRSTQKMIYDDTEDYLNVTSKADFDIANCAENDRQEDMDEADMKDLFIGGDYAENAKKFLDAENESENEDDMFGDFEELDDENESPKEPMKGSKKDRGEPEDEETAKKKREEIKKNLKEKFDMEYDDGGDEKSFYKEWKAQVEEQTKVSSSHTTR
jgi:ribosome biogenesis protein BMS1